MRLVAIACREPKICSTSILHATSFLAFIHLIDTARRDTHKRQCCNDDLLVMLPLRSMYTSITCYSPLNGFNLSVPHFQQLMRSKRQYFLSSQVIPDSLLCFCSAFSVWLVSSNHFVIDLRSRGFTGFESTLAGQILFSHLSKFARLQLSTRFQIKVLHNIPWMT